MNGNPLLLGKQLSPKYENIEKNIFSKPLSAERKSPLVSYVKPYHLNPSIDFTTEYISKTCQREKMFSYFLHLFFVSLLLTNQSYSIILIIYAFHFQSKIQQIP